MIAILLSLCLCALLWIGWALYLTYRAITRRQVRFRALQRLIAPQQAYRPPDHDADKRMGRTSPTNTLIKL